MFNRTFGGLLLFCCWVVLFFSLRSFHHVYMTAFSFFPSPASAGYCRGGVPFSISFQGQPGPAGAALDGGKGFRSDVTAAPAALRQGEKVAAQEKRESSKAENIFPLLPLFLSFFPNSDSQQTRRKRMRDSSGFRRPIPHGGCLIDLRDSSWRLISAFFSSTGGHCFTSQVLSFLHNSQFVSFSADFFVLSQNVSSQFLDGSFLLFLSLLAVSSSP